MAQKKEKLTEEQKSILKTKGINPILFEVMQDFPNSLMIKNRLTGEAQVVEK